MSTNLIILLCALILNALNTFSLLIDHAAFKKTNEQNDPIHEITLTNKKIRILGFIVIEMILIYFIIKELI